MTAPVTTGIPIYLSRFTPNLPEPYGGLIAWKKGERAITRRDRTLVTIHDPELKWHDDAPEIDSARGPGRWVIEVIVDGETDPCAVSAAVLRFTDAAKAAIEDEWKQFGEATP